MIYLIIQLSTDESGNLKLPTNQNGKICATEIQSKDNGKTVMIEDVGQSKISLKLQDSVDKITIVQNSNKPLEIFVSNDNNVEVTIENSQLTTFSGSGKVTLLPKEQQDDQTIELEQLCPSFDSNLEINSDSKIKVKKVDLYENSKVEFSENADAKVESLYAQQKSVTTLQNVQIEKELIVGLQSTVTINDNVNLNGATIELKYAAISQQEALIKGKLNSTPQIIKIKNLNIDDYLDDNEFCIAESNSDSFECQQWADAFDTNSNTKFNRAACLPKDKNGNVKLIADNKGTTSGGDGSDGGKGKDGMNPGVIAAIVIVVIVVVAVVVILVLYFVFHKKKAESSQNENSDGNTADEI